MDWLTEYSKMYMGHHGLDWWVLMSVTVQLLEENMGIHNLSYKLVLMDKTVPKDRILDSHQPGEPMVPILALFTFRCSPNKKKLTWAQVDI
jgi:hypothetical protein